MESGKRKVGRNEICPECQSGKKYKRCHGDPSRASSKPTGRPVPPFVIKKLDPNDIPPAVLAKARELEHQDRRHVSQFGHARPPIAAEYMGHRFVAVGNQLIYRPVEETLFFTDILGALLGLVFGREWWDAELAKPRGQRHPAFEWRYEAFSFMNKKRPVVGEEFYSAQMTGPMLAYFTFAYDLFVVRDNGHLDARLLERLKHPEQFQGARHELFAEATCLRAGFTIEHENEADGSMRHAEFTATHTATGEKVSVEAKSKHRPGVMGRPGAPEELGKHNLLVGRLLNDAVGKNVPHPLVVFLDMNLPWVSAARIMSVQPPRPPHPLIVKTLDRLRVGELRMDPINLLVVTNHPEHYTADEETATSPQLLSVMSMRPLRPTKKPQALKDIHGAANLYGNIPQSFDAAVTWPNC